MSTVKTPWAPWMGEVPMHLDYFQGTMAEAVERIGQKYGKYDAYEFMGSHVSYEKLVAQIHECAAALRAMFRAIAVLPWPGRAPMTMRFPSCQPMVMESKDGNPDGTPVNPVDCCDRCIRSNALFSASPSST